jgi:hypothetical protein
MGSCYSIYLSFITRSDVIRIKNGLIQGRSLTFDGGKQVDAYLGIPYGKPPIGELRFKVVEKNEKKTNSLQIGGDRAILPRGYSCAVLILHLQ